MLTATWDAPTVKPTGRYIVDLYTGSSATGNALKTLELRKKKTQILITGLMAGTQYTVSVKAQNENSVDKTAGNATTVSKTAGAAE